MAKQGSKTVRAPRAPGRTRAMAIATLVALQAAGLIMPPAAAQPGPRPEVPVVVAQEPDYDACALMGLVEGLRTDGDGFLAVRGGPGTNHRKLDEIYNGQQVYVCEQRGAWYGIVYARDPSDGCNVTTPWPVALPYTGPCKSGWAHGNWITIMAG